MPDPTTPGRVMVDVTMFQEPIEVPEDEVPALRAQGLIRVKRDDSADAPAAASKPKSATRKDDQPS